MFQDDIKDCALLFFEISGWTFGAITQIVVWSLASGQVCSFPHAATRSLLDN